MDESMKNRRYMFHHVIKYYNVTLWSLFKILKMESALWSKIIILIVIKFSIIMIHYVIMWVIFQFFVCFLYFYTLYFTVQHASMCACAHVSMRVRPDEKITRFKVCNVNYEYEPQRVTLISSHIRSILFFHRTSKDNRCIYTSTKWARD